MMVEDEGAEVSAGKNMSLLGDPGKMAFRGMDAI